MERARSGYLMTLGFIEEECECGTSLWVDNRLYAAVLLPWEEASEITADACRNCLVAPSRPELIMLCQMLQHKQ